LFKRAPLGFRLRAVVNARVGQVRATATGEEKQNSCNNNDHARGNSGNPPRKSALLGEMVGNIDDGVCVESAIDEQFERDAATTVVRPFQVQFRVISTGKLLLG
jgi:hypothetical protein